MPRPTVMLFLLMMIFFTSRIEFKPPVSNKIATVTATDFYSYRLPESQHSFLKEKIILSHEQSIQKLNELVQTLKKQLEICKARRFTVVNDTTSTGTGLLNEIEQQ